MPGILRSKKKFALCCLLLLAVLLFVTPVWYVSLFLVACVALLCLNQLVVNKNMRPYHLAFSAKREVKQWDTIVIGILPPPSRIGGTWDINAEHTLLLLSPDRSLEASCQILLHAGSVINNNNGKIIILNDGRQRKSKAYTIFDIPYLGLIARKQLGLESQLRKVPYPLLYEPLRSLKLLLGIGHKDYVQRECPNEEIVRYCKRKGFTLTYMESS